MKLKERLRGIVAAVATAALALSVAPVTAMAAEIPGTGSIKVTGLVTGDQISVYKVAETETDKYNQLVNTWLIDNSDDQLPDINNNTGGAFSADVANLVATLASNLGVAGTGTADVNGEATVDNLDAGLYLVKVTNDSDATRVYQNTLIPVVPKDSNKNGSFDSGDTWETQAKNIKYSKTGIEKQVKEGDDVYADSIDTLGYGDTADFKLTVTVPKYASNASARTFTVTDAIQDAYFDLNTLSADGVFVSASDVDLEKGTDYTVSYDSASGLLTVDFTNTGLEKLAAVETVEITYSVMVDATQPGHVENLNTATLNFSKNSYGTETEDDSDTVAGTFYALQIKKVDEDDNPLAGAEFEVTGDNGKMGGTLTSAANTGLTDMVIVGNGDVYSIDETKAPAGYSVANIEDVTIDGEDAEDYVITLTVTNTLDTASILPSTGGTGTVALTVVGVGLMAGAAFLVMRSRKEN
ncbi:MAG TPA: SpaH/EbpB family LPXTG-anchored major pilin [Candidatus Olsenella avistercoris]|nr:SpaH/EbpB family LPXTG-anchored major pilin [Candidatus Olsenella avistercoris]